MTKRKSKILQENNSENDTLFNNMPEYLEKKYFQLLKKYKISKKTLEGSFQNFLIKFVRLGIKSLYDKEELKTLIECMEFININMEKILLNSDVVDKEVYDHMKNTINNGISINKEKIEEVLNSYLKSVSMKESIDTIIQTILLNRDWYYGFLSSFKKKIDN